MEFEERLTALANKLKQQINQIQTEEATKTAIVMPFIHTILGYDIFNPSEVIPEFTADVGTKKGEKVDYAIYHNDNLQILIEAKKINEDLNIKHASQLYRYFSVTSAKLAILTNGQVYKFFTDLDSPNKMDEKPFLELDILDIDEHSLPELKKITKQHFDISSIISAAGDLKYVTQIKKNISQQLKTPDEDFAKLLICKVYDGVITQKVREQFAPLIAKASSQFIADQINDRLKSAMLGSGSQQEPQKEPSESLEGSDDDNGIVTTVEEIEGFNIVKAIARKVVNANRIIGRDTKSYFGVLLDDNNRKPICRLHFNRSQKYLGIFNEEKEEARIPIETLDDLFKYEEQIQKTALSYD